MTFLHKQVSIITDKDGFPLLWIVSCNPIQAADCQLRLLGWLYETKPISEDTDADVHQTATLAELQLQFLMRFTRPSLKGRLFNCSHK